MFVVSFVFTPGMVCHAKGDLQKYTKHKNPLLLLWKLLLLLSRIWSFTLHFMNN